MFSLWQAKGDCDQRMGAHLRVLHGSANCRRAGGMGSKVHR